MHEYGLIIVDDEEMMRDGLSSLIKWADLGFHLDGVFEDGSDAIEWLGENDTHVILTDLKMTHSSGLDVASFVREKKLDIKIVIISGYSDFEAAQKALGYRISDYLLKPISAKTIRESFHRLKDELDKAKEERESVRQEIENFESLKSYVEERFISQLVLGGFRRPTELHQQLQLIKWDPSALKKPCVLFTLSIESDASWDSDSNNRNNLIGGMISRLVAPSKFYWHRATRRDLGGIIVECESFQGLKEKVHNCLETVVVQAKALAVKIAINRVQSYRNLETLASSTEPRLPIGGEEKGNLQTEREERRRLIISHILENQEILTFELLDSYMDFLRERSWDALINGLVDLFTNIKSTFNKISAFHGEKGLISFADFFSLRSRDAVYEWTRETIREVMRHVQQEAPGNRDTLIDRAKKYIEQNYADDILLTHVADEVNLSPVYFSRLFKEQTGETFSDFLISCRIDQARRLLKETKKKVYEICEEVGYTDIKHFYGLFKRQVGCTPSEYRHGK